jgi:hypothetical protein
MQFKKTHNEKNSTDAVSAQRWESTNLLNLLQRICADDVFIANETGLVYHATPDGSLSYRHVALFGSKKAKDRVVFCCSSIEGTDKRKLLAIETG